VPGKTEIWKYGYILEENLKENNISFWINKHNRYSDLVAQEEVERMQQLRLQTLQPRFWGSPDERTAWLKQLWWKMPRYARPTIYFIYRMFFQLGILDGRTGIIFHFLQAFWFRLIVDIKIDELLSPPQKASLNGNHKKSGPLTFVFSFIVLFVLFYYFNILYFSMTEPYSRHYIPWLANHLNYISALRTGLLKSSEQILNWLGYTSLSNEYDLLLVGHGVLKLVYSCLGLGVISFFAAFVIAYPRKWKSKVVFLISGIIGIELLNIARFVLLALFWSKQHARIIDHHTIFNIFIYLAIALTLCFWVKSDNVLNDTDAAD
jgi:exosortase/archaeosortase family protein